MDRRRRVYRPEVVGTLEDRLVLSAAAPVNFAPLEHGPRMHPVVVATFEGSDQAKVITHGGKPGQGQLTFSAQEVLAFAPNGSGPAVGIFEVDYHNGSSKPITSATIEDTLGPDLAYVPAGTYATAGGQGSPDALVRLAPNLSYFPGGSHVPPGGQLAVTTNAKGAQVVELKLPGGIAPGAEGFLEFEAEVVAPSRR